jgi:hypothetical protein
MVAALPVSQQTHIAGYVSVDSRLCVDDTRSYCQLTPLGEGQLLLVVLALGVGILVMLSNGVHLSRVV